MKIRNLVLLLLTAMFCFGGTFTCESEGGSTVVRPTPDEQRP